MYKGDLLANQTIHHWFNTVDVGGAPITLSGSPAVKVFKMGNSTPVTTGVTLDVDYGGITGLNHVAITTTDAFYAAGNDFAAIISAGTVDSVSVVGQELFDFSIQNRCVASVSGAVGSVTANVNAAVVSIGANCITAASIAADALAAIWNYATTITAGIGLYLKTALPNAAPGASGGLPTTNGTKVNQTADLTAGQSIAVSDKTGFSLSTAGILAIWNQLTADAGILANTFGVKLKNWVLGSDSKALLSTDSQAGVTIPTVTTLTNAPSVPTAVSIRQEIDSNSTQLAAIKAKTDLTALDSTVAKHSDITGLNNLSTSDIDARLEAFDPPTRTEATADTAAILAALPAAPDNTDLAAIKVVTDKFRFTITNQVDANALTGGSGGGGGGGGDVPPGYVVQDFHVTVSDTPVSGAWVAVWTGSGRTGTPFAAGYTDISGNVSLPVEPTTH
jgi:hypothetical protein